MEFLKIWGVIIIISVLMVASAHLVKWIATLDEVIYRSILVLVTSFVAAAIVYVVRDIDRNDKERGLRDL